MSQDDIELLEQVFLLAMLNKEKDESIEDIIAMLFEAKALSLNEAAMIVEGLKIKGAIINDRLSFLGITLANQAKEKFKLN